MTDSNSTDIGENHNETLGSLFKKTRSGLHLSIEDAAAKTRVHARILRDLENDNYKRMPAEVFVRGFIKLYANFLGLDPNETMSIYVLQENAHPDRPADMPYRQHILTGEGYVNPPLYQQSKKKISVISIGLIIIAMIVIIVSVLPESIDKPAIDKQTHEQPLQQGLPADNDSIPVSPPQVEPEITVDRPPAMNIKEEPVSHIAAGGESSEPIERSPVLDRKPYKISKKPEKAEDSAAPVTIAKENVEPEAIKTAATSPKAAAAEISDDMAQAAPIEIPALRPAAESTNEPSSTSLPDSTDNGTQTERVPLEIQSPEQDKEIYREIKIATAVEPTAAPEPLISATASKTENTGQPETETATIQEETSPSTDTSAAHLTNTRQPEPSATDDPSPVKPMDIDAGVSDTDRAREQGSPPPARPLPVKFVTTKPAVESDDESEPETALPDNLPAKYVLKAQFIESTWMRIQVDSKTPRQYTYKPGMIKTWKADRNIFLHLGNGGGVTLTLNGKPLPTGAPSGKVSKINIPDDLP